MTRVVVDASVVVKWFFEESDFEAARRLRDSDVSLLAPDLIGPEIANTLWKRARRGELTVKDAVLVIVAFNAQRLQIEASRPLLSAAVDLALKIDRSSYDALYLALAMQQNCPMITADRKFYNAVAATPLADHIRWIADPF